MVVGGIVVEGGGGGVVGEGVVVDGGEVVNGSVGPSTDWNVHLNPLRLGL